MSLSRAMLFALPIGAIAISEVVAKGTGSDVVGHARVWPARPRLTCAEPKLITTPDHVARWVPPPCLAYAAVSRYEACKSPLR
jgi:hypothetical protein